MRELAFLLGSFGQAASDAVTAEVGDAELTANLPVIVIMELDLEGPRRPMEIQALTGLASSASVTRLIDRLEERGIVQRTFGAVPGDRRATVISLTPEGERVAGQLALGLEKHIALFRSQLHALLDFIDELDPSEVGATPP
jgi:DNA-binding MarR family transcriptional regulator